MKITTNNNKHIITSEIVWMRQLISSRVSFVSSSEVLVAFNISSSYSKTNFTIRRFLHEQFFMFKYLSILHEKIRFTRISHTIIFARTSIISFFTLTPTFITIPFLLWITYT